MPIRLINGSSGDIPTAHPMTIQDVVMEAHRVCQPVKLTADGSRIPVTLTDRVAGLYLSLRDDLRLRPLDGITTGPVLTESGEIRDGEGYDSGTRLFCARVPQLVVPSNPSRTDAEKALLLLRLAFRTFPFADAPRVFDDELGLHVIDVGKPAGADESAMLIGLLTAIARPNLWLAPGLIVRAASISGAGTGKGLLVRAICQIAFGISPRAFTGGSEKQELDKRLAAELIEAGQVLFLDNVNGCALRSDLLASAMTERPSRVRLLGKTVMVPLNSTAFVAVTGNGLSLSEDLARRFILCDLDAQIENPEDRSFPGNFLKNIGANRAGLLSATLTIWRWGRQNAGSLKSGRPLGSFETWGEWVRDPFFTLGCADPVLRISDTKAADPKRQRTAELFAAWYENHGDRPVKRSELADAVRELLDPQDRGRQWQAAQLHHLDGTRIAGFLLQGEKAGGKWSATTYAVTRTMGGEGIGTIGSTGAA